jgi:hypothetical protein
MAGTSNPNFSEMEIQVLLDELGRKKIVIFLKLANLVTNNKISRVWETILWFVCLCVFLILIRAPSLTPTVFGNLALS